MRLFLLPISTRRTLIYCDRVATQVNASGKLSYHDRIVNKANETWASWENSPNKYKKKLTDYGNVIFNRISYEEWGLKTLPSSTADLTPTEIVFPGRFLDQQKVPDILRKLATERQGLHKQRFWGSLIGLPFTIPVGLLPVIPNIPGLYLGFRAWSHFKGQFESPTKSFTGDVNRPWQYIGLNELNDKPLIKSQSLTASQHCTGLSSSKL